MSRFYSSVSQENGDGCILQEGPLFSSSSSGLSLSSLEKEQEESNSEDHFDSFISQFKASFSVWATHCMLCLGREPWEHSILLHSVALSSTALSQEAFVTVLDVFYCPLSLLFHSIVLFMIFITSKIINWIAHTYFKIQCPNKIVQHQGATMTPYCR